jgi:hypothetical protein
MFPYFIALECQEDASIYQNMEHPQLSGTHQTRIGIGIANAMCALHGLNLNCWAPNLNPHNVFLTSTFLPKLTFFNPSSSAELAVL